MSGLAREVRTLQERVHRLESRRLPALLPVLEEHFVPLLAAVPDVIGAAVEEELEGWHVWVFLEGWDRRQEKAVYAAEHKTLLALAGSIPVRFLLEPETTPEEFESRAAEMVVVYLRPEGGSRAQQAGASYASQAQ
jgi:hypothetical protein